MEQEPVMPHLDGNTIIVDGCPVVGKAKADLLKNVLLKKFSAIGEIIYSNLPMNDTEQTSGYMFLTYATPELATKAVKEMNNLALDKAHTLLVTSLSDYSKSINVGKHWNPPEKKPYHDVGNLRSWLLNEFARNQFALLHQNGDKCSIFWHTNSEEIRIEERDDWSEGWIHWSPHGTYLATMHSQGVILWGGDKFERVARFAHRDVGMLDFSPNEKFMVTLSQNAEAREKQNHSLCDMIIWDVRKGTPCRNFSGSINSWPTFKWSHDDAYVATLQGGKIYIYETESFRLIDKKPLAMPVSIYDFAWSPTENIISFWTPETNNTPARVALMSIPSRKELCTKNLFSVAEIQLIWHPQGDFLCVQVLRCNKKKIEGGQVKYLGTFVNFELVRMREKLYPIDQVSVKDAATVTCFAWEPTGNRFAYIATDSSGKITIPLYELTKSGKVGEVSIFDRGNSRINELRWSPKGGTFVIASLRTADATIEFIDANDCQSVAKVDHAMASELHWDGTGRYLASVVSWFKHKSDNAVWFWNSVGRPLYHKQVTGLHIFAWRPFPPSLLTPEQIQSIKKTLASKYSAQFDAEDKMLASKASREVIERRQVLASEFNVWRTSLLSRYSADKAKRDKLRGVDTDKEVGEETEEELEFLVKTSREVVRRES
ncbi:unnamed protein product [Mesocestoides corti]|nr:unnamed protein product [Mesocestoides corti]